MVRSYCLTCISFDIMRAWSKSYGYCTLKKIRKYKPYQNCQYHHQINYLKEYLDWTRTKAKRILEIIKEIEEKQND